MTISTAVCNTATVAAKPLTGGDTHRHGQTEAALKDVQDRGDRQDAGGFLRGREGAAVPHAMDFQGSTLLSEKGFPQQPQREDRATRGAGSDSLSGGCRSARQCHGAGSREEATGCSSTEREATVREQWRDKDCADRQNLPPPNLTEINQKRCSSSTRRKKTDDMKCKE